MFLTFLFLAVFFTYFSIHNSRKVTLPGYNVKARPSKIQLVLYFSCASISVVNHSEKIIAATSNSWQNVQKKHYRYKRDLYPLKVDAASKRI